MNHLTARRASPEKRKTWQTKAARKLAVVPEYFEVSTQTAFIVCGKCKHQFKRNLVPNVNEPVFICPDEKCKARNWTPITYKISYS